MGSEGERGALCIRLPYAPHHHAAPNLECALSPWSGSPSPSLQPAGMSLRPLWDTKGISLSFPAPWVTGRQLAPLPQKETRDQELPAVPAPEDAKRPRGDFQYSSLEIESGC